MKRLFTVMLFMVLSSQAAWGLETFKTGDKGLDKLLGDINKKALSDVDWFKRELNSTFGVPASRIDSLLKTEKMPPGDIYMAVSIFRMTGRPFEMVLQEYRMNKGQGWDVITKKLGIKPGSREFHALKNNRLAASVYGKGPKGKQSSDKKGPEPRKQ